MVGLAENVQACLRIFRRAQHQWLVRDICIKRKGFLLFMSYGSPQKYTDEEPILRRTAFQADARWCVIYPRALPPVTI